MKYTTYRIKPLSQNADNGYIAEVSSVGESGVGGVHLEAFTDLEEYFRFMYEASDANEQLNIHVYPDPVVKIDFDNEP